jgi:NADH-quinone oxidoreductase subunit M
MPPLSILIWLPVACGVAGALLSAAGLRRLPGGLTPAGGLALLGSLAAFGLSIGYIAEYHGHELTGPLTDVTDVVWISALGIHYKLGIDGLNVILIGLTTLVFSLALLSANLRKVERPQLYYPFFTLVESAVLGAFLAQDLALFVAFFDLMLIPFYFLMGMWGGANRVPATIKLVIYTLVGSLLMLAAAVATGVLAAEQHHTALTFTLSSLKGLPISTGPQEWIFLGFAAAFLVKMPAFPLHGWLPDGYSAMSDEVLMVFSGVLSKVGAYGFLAIVLPLFPQATVHFQMLMLLIALASILYGSVVAFTQTDARLIAGYSSIAQLGFITLGIFALDPKGVQGALLQMLNHGLVVAPLFFIVALLAERAGGSRDIRHMGGIAFRAPVFAALFLIVALATLAMPGSANFVGEFLILLGTFKAKLAIAIIGSTGVILASVYAIRLFIRSMHNRVGSGVDSREISVRDGLVLAPFVAVILFFAFYPQLALERTEGSARSAVVPPNGVRAIASADARSARLRPAGRLFAALAAGDSPSRGEASRVTRSQLDLFASKR